MKSQNWNKRLAAVIFAVMAVCLCAGLWNSAPRGGETYAADTDTVTVSGLSVEWDGNSGAQDLVFLALDGATFASPAACNETWAYFAGSIFINGVAATGNVAWAQTRQYDRPGTFAVFINNNVLKQDGTDVIEIAAGCKIPKVGGADADYTSFRKRLRSGQGSPRRPGKRPSPKFFPMRRTKNTTRATKSLRQPMPARHSETRLRSPLRARISACRSRPGDLTAGRRTPAREQKQTIMPNSAWSMIWTLRNSRASRSK